MATSGAGDNFKLRPSCQLHILHHYHYAHRCFYEMPMSGIRLSAAILYIQVQCRLSPARLRTCDPKTDHTLHRTLPQHGRCTCCSSRHAEHSMHARILACERMATHMAHAIWPQNHIGHDCSARTNKHHGPNAPKKTQNNLAPQQRSTPRSDPLARGSKRLRRRLSSYS